MRALELGAYRFSVAWGRVLPEGTLTNWDGLKITGNPDREGLDLNRNFPAGWRQEFEQVGAGPYPTSEPEVRAMVDFIVRHPNIGAAVSFHTHSGVILRPMGTQSDDDMTPEEAAQRIIEAIVNQGITNMFASPALLERLADHCRGRSVTFPSVRTLFTGGAGRISVTCPCGATFSVEAKFAGRQGSCPKCRQTLDEPRRIGVDAKRRLQRGESHLVDPERARERIRTNRVEVLPPAQDHARLGFGGHPARDIHRVAPQVPHELLLADHPGDDQEQRQIDAAAKALAALPPEPEEAAAAPGRAAPC